MDFDTLLGQSTIAHLHPELVYVDGGQIVPSKALNYKYKPDGSGGLSFWDKVGVTTYERRLRNDLTKKLAGIDIFPTSQEVHVALTLGTQKNKYAEGDIDNKAKTILDAMKGPVYADDRQVKILHVDKVETDNNQNWCLISVKVL